MGKIREPLRRSKLLYRESYFRPALGFKDNPGALSGRCSVRRNFGSDQVNDCNLLSAGRMP